MYVYMYKQTVHRKFWLHGGRDDYLQEHRIPLCAPSEKTIQGVLFGYAHDVRIVKGNY